MRKLPLSFFFLSFLALAAAQGTFAVRALAEEDGPAPADASEGKKSDKKGKGEENDITGGRFAGDPVYVHIKPMVLPVINDDGVEQLVSLVLDIHVKDAETADKLHKDMPRVVDALMRNLYGELEEGSVRKGKLVSIEKIKKRAIRAVSEVVGKDKVVDVLVEGITQRML